MIALLFLLQNHSPDDAPSLTEPNGKHYAIKSSPCIGCSTLTMRSMNLYNSGAFLQRMPKMCIYHRKGYYVYLRC